MRGNVGRPVLRAATCFIDGRTGRRPLDKVINTVRKTSGMKVKFKEKGARRLAVNVIEC